MVWVNYFQVGIFVGFCATKTVELQKLRESTYSEREREMVMYKLTNNHVDLIVSYSDIFWLHAHIKCKSIQFIMFIYGFFCWWSKRWPLNEVVNLTIYVGFTSDIPRNSGRICSNRNMLLETGFTLSTWFKVWMLFAREKTPMIWKIKGILVDLPGKARSSDGSYSLQKKTFLRLT